MKFFITWLLIFSLIFIGLSVSYHFLLSINPTKILIEVDTSYFMSSSWQNVTERIRQFKKKRYMKYALITDKRFIHSWSDELRYNEIDNIKPYGPRELENFSNTDKYKEIKEANRILIFTDEKDLSKIKRDFRYQIIKP